MSTNARTMTLAASLPVVILVLAAAVAAAVPVSSGPDYEALAQKLVSQCAAIHAGDLVTVFGGVRDLELLEDIAVNVRKAGAFPLVTIGSDRMTRRMYTDVPAAYDSQSPEFDLKIAGAVTVEISITSGEAEGLLADIPTARRIAVSNAAVPVSNLLLQRNVRIVYLGNGLYPTDALAKEYGMTKELLANTFWAGVNVDYTQLQETARKLKGILSSGKEAHLTNPNGTDLKVRIEGRPVFASDGVISPEDQQRGGLNCWLYLPAGEVFLAPVPGTATGKVVVDRQFYEGKEINDLTLIFERGKLTSMTAKAGLEGLKAMYDAAGPGKDEFAFVDIGINPDVRLAPGSRMVAWMPAGMVTVGIGDNTFAGGDNKIAYGLSTFMPGSTLEIDGRPVVEKGVLKLQ